MGGGWRMREYFMRAEGVVLTPRPSGGPVGAEDLTERADCHFIHTPDLRSVCVCVERVTDKEGFSMRNITSIKRVCLDDHLIHLHTSVSCLCLYNRTSDKKMGWETEVKQWNSDRWRETCNDQTLYYIGGSLALFWYQITWSEPFVTHKPYKVWQMWSNTVVGERKIAGWKYKSIISKHLCTWNYSLKFTFAKANGKRTAKINLCCFLRPEGDIWVRFSEGKQSPVLVRLHRVDIQAAGEILRKQVQTARQSDTRLKHQSYSNSIWNIRGNDH